MKLPIPVDRFVKATKGAVAAGCPACGAYGKTVLCGPATKARIVCAAGCEKHYPPGTDMSDPAMHTSGCERHWTVEATNDGRDKHA